MYEPLSPVGHFIFEPPRMSSNPHFTGRGETLDQLEQVLSVRGPKAVLVAITGLGGVGKTELVIEYAHRHRDRYDLVFTLHAGAKATVRGDMQRLAGEVGLSQAWDGVRERVLQWLQTRDRWLLIFDNADHLSAVADYLPDGPGHVLITSRDQVWRQRAAIVEVDVWKPEESAEFLSSRLGRTGISETKGIAQIAEMLSHLPLALEQAAAYMEETGASYLEYIRLFNEHGGGELLKGGAPVGLGYEKTVAMTWNITLEEINRTRPEALEFLQLCAYLGPDLLPEAIFLTGGDILPDTLRAVVSARKTFNEALGILDRYRLVRRSSRPSGFLSMHRLVQQVVRMSVEEEGLARERVSTCVRLLSKEFPAHRASTGTDADATQAALLPHVLAVVPHAIGMDSESEMAQRLLMSVGEYMGRQAQMEGAKASHAQVVTIVERVYGHDTPQMGRILAALGHVLLDKDDLPAACACFERALAIIEGVYGPDSGEVVDLLNDLSETLLQQDDVTGAQAYLRRAARLQAGDVDGI